MHRPSCASARPSPRTTPTNRPSCVARRTEAPPDDDPASRSTPRRDRYSPGRFLCPHARGPPPESRPRSPRVSQASSSDLVLETREDQIATLTFNDQAHRNAMTRAMGEAFRDRVEALRGDETLRAVVITGGGSAFSAGGDLEMISDVTQMARDGKREEVQQFMRSFYELFLSIGRVPVPTIAAINGHAIGAGLCVALGCDIRYIAREAKVGLNFTKLGLHPGMGASWTLPRLVGPALAAELMYTSRIVGGEEARDMGIASRCLPAEEVLPAAVATAREIAGCSPIAVRSLKKGLAHTLDAADLGSQLDFEASEQSACFASEDMLEGLAAARERRAPEFKGR
ncbi:MAG: enoyl-CoA hydratase/isomerase family protein [bacterium]|nr:enoyl-CoA hydratase/isomerase family protein [bacterium]